MHTNWVFGYTRTYCYYLLGNSVVYTANIVGGTYYFNIFISDRCELTNHNIYLHKVFNSARVPD